MSMQSVLQTEVNANNKNILIAQDRDSMVLH